jgi:hypothetical protein
LFWLSGGRIWWAHFTRINITPTLLRKKIEDLREVRAFDVDATKKIEDLRQLGACAFPKCQPVLTRELHARGQLGVV